MIDLALDAVENVLTLDQPDGYRTHYRRWGPATADDVVVMLHGGMSHSGWQFPLGTRLGRRPGTAFVAVDLRGSGLNAGRGHIPSADLAVGDIVQVLRHLHRDYRRIHLAGWCFGAQVATAQVQPQLMKRRQAAQLDLAVRVRGSLMQVHRCYLHQIDVIGTLRDSGEVLKSGGHQSQRLGEIP